MPPTNDWDALVAAKRAERASKIRPDWILPQDVLSQVSPESASSAFALLEQAAFLTPRERELTENYDATALLEMMASRRLTSSELTTAICKRAAAAQQLTNCLTEIFFERALERAAECDDYIRKTGKPMGPLHGLPVSVKDTFMIKGIAATLGLVAYLKKPLSDHDSFLTEMLLEAGAVLYCKTNVPQTMFVCESYNNVFGTTMNPYRLNLTTGGSSSGEGGMVGFRASMLGIGTDIGGSVRIPALCNGVFGFKPSSDRIPFGKQQEFQRLGSPGIVLSAGPLATSARDLTLLVKTIVTAKPWMRDSTCHAIPWRDLAPKPKLKIGVWLGDENVPLTPPVLRNLKAAARKLAASGHDVIFPECPSLVRAGLISATGYAFDTTRQMFKVLEDGDEKPIPALQSTRLPKTKKGRTNLDDVWSYNVNQADYREEWAEVWRTHKLDVLLCAGSRQVAPPHGKYGVPWYSLIWNVLDFPSSVIPFGRVEKSLDSVPMEESPFPLEYDVEKVSGLPCSVQVVGWKFMDEETLQATETIAASLERLVPKM